MTVAELIEKLKQMPQEAEAVFPGESFDYSRVTEVHVDDELSEVLDCPSAYAKREWISGVVVIG